MGLAFYSRKQLSRSYKAWSQSRPVPMNLGPVPVPILRSVDQHIFFSQLSSPDIVVDIKPTVHNLFSQFLIMQNAAWYSRHITLIMFTYVHGHNKV